jgi:ATP-binding cassette subfamily B protein
MEKTGSNGLWPTCLKIIAEFFGKDFHLDYLREISFLQKGGVSLAGLSLALEKLV